MMRQQNLVFSGAAAALAVGLLAATAAVAAPVGIGDVIALDWSTTGDADGGDLSNWNQTNDGTADLAAGSVVRLSDGAVVDGVSISFQNGVAGNFNNDAGSANPLFLPNDPYFVAGADDIYFHGSTENLIATFGGLDPSLSYNVRIYHSLNRDDALVTDFIVNGGPSTGPIGEGTAFNSLTLEAAGLVLSNVSATPAGDIAIEVVAQGPEFYPLQAMVIEAIPEPSTLALVSLAAVAGLAVWRRW